MVRYLPVFIGVVLATAFTLSVLYDTAEIALVAWSGGADLLGLYGGFGAVVLPFLFVASGAWRRGRRQPVTWAELHGDHLTIELGSGRKLEIPTSRVRSAYTCDAPRGRTRISLELEGGLTDGDRMVLELEPRFAEPIAAAFTGDSTKLDLAREGTSTSAVIHAAAIALGIAAASFLMFRIERVLPAVDPSDATNWWLGLAVACAGFSHAVMTLLSTPPTVAVGVDGVCVEGIVRKRFIPFADMVDVRAAWLGIIFRTRDSSHYVFAPGVGEARVATLLSRTRARLVDTATAQSATSPASVRELRVALEKSLEPSTYRVAPSTDATLGESLLAPGLTRRARFAAAATLAARGDREPIRIAASAVADETTRALLERLAEDEADLESIEAAMERAR